MSGHNSLDVIIPCRDSAAVLPRTLDDLFHQQLAPSCRWGIIAVDDGSRDGTLAYLQKTAAHLPPSRLTVLSQFPAGAAAARNRGAAYSQADVVLFLGADILLRPNALSAHYDFHLRFPGELFAALGFIRWDPRLPPSPLMEWLEHGGPQNNYDAVLGCSPVPPEHYFYGSHLSLKRRVLPPRPFNESFHAYGWEDLELGRRLAAQGLQLKPLPSALGLHRHYYSPSAFYNRQYQAGKSLVAYQSLHPSADILPWRPAPRRLLHRLLPALGLISVLKLFVSLFADRCSMPRLYQLAASAVFWQGVDASLSTKANN